MIAMTFDVALLVARGERVTMRELVRRTGVSRRVAERSVRAAIARGELTYAGRSIVRGGAS